MKKVCFLFLLTPIILFGQVKEIDTIYRLEDIKTNSNYFKLQYIQNADSSYRLELIFYFPKKLIKEFSRDVSSDSILPTCESKKYQNNKGALSELVFDNIKPKYKVDSVNEFLSTYSWNSAGQVCFVQGNNIIVRKEIFFASNLEINRQKKVNFSMVVILDSCRYFFLTYKRNLQFLSSNNKYNDIIKKSVNRGKNYKKTKKEDYNFAISPGREYTIFLRKLNLDNQDE